VCYLETLAESFIIVDMQEQLAAQNNQTGPGKAAPMVQPQKKEGIISVTMGEEEEGNYEYTVDEEKGNLNLKK
jgi:hypothetical protein